MKRKPLMSITCALVLCVSICNAARSAQSVDSYLSKPTGQYGIGFEDFHWINQNNCPDYNFNGKNIKDFSPSNKKHCHEIMARIYYPTLAKIQTDTPYYPPFIKASKTDLKTIPTVTTKQIQQLDKVKSYSIEKSPIVTGKTFPVVIFNPGFGVQTQLYENIINELVSQGYIVVGVNTIFINGDIKLPNGHVVKTAIPKSRDEADKKFLPIQMQDLSYVFKKIHMLHHSDSIFSAMDINHIGVFGHSIGRTAVEKTIRIHPNWFQAAATLDIGSYEPAPIKKSAIPFMHQISAYWELFFSWPVVFELGTNGYLVTLSPSTQNKHYSYHLNYTDFSTLQYLPAFQAYLAYDKKKKSAGEDIKLMSHEPTTQESRKFNTPTYVLIKDENKWRLFYYESGKKITNISIDMIAGLETAVTNLPKKVPEQLTVAEIKQIQEAINAYHLGFGNFLGTGDGFKIANSINTYVVQFFDTFLKDKKNPELQNCKAFSSDTILKCGPGIFK